MTTVSALRSRAVACAVALALAVAPLGAGAALAADGDGADSSAPATESATAGSADPSTTAPQPSASDSSTAPSTTSPGSPAPTPTPKPTNTPQPTPVPTQSSSAAPEPSPVEPEPEPNASNGDSVAPEPGRSPHRHPGSVERDPSNGSGGSVSSFGDDAGNDWAPSSQSSGERAASDYSDPVPRAPGGDNADAIGADGATTQAAPAGTADPNADADDAGSSFAEGFSWPIAVICGIIALALGIAVFVLGRRRGAAPPSH
ncbi:hypothetical protein BRM1_06255 [Brevibacterium sp. BRM-1]|uniref:hypothetical protein n=1 Tax=Brevibacterium sp. BRM-1 TaxID=2999062 RepID=UPI00227DE1FC|nr:hypothetical protein [Brevibacterium sp. BRM-1]WAL41440.1 hypothetical protein BRM1_06255 [Brevibacterium sp. BRM-1]